MDLSSIEKIIRAKVKNAQDSEIELYLDSVKRDMEKFNGDYSDMSEDDIVEDFEFYIQSKMDEAQKPSMKMKKSKLKEIIKSAMLSEMGSDPQYADEGAYSFVDEAEEDLDEMLARLSEKEIEEGEDKVVDPYLAEAEEGEDAEEEIEDELDIDVDTEEEVDGKEEKTNDSIVIDKKIVSLSSLPGETRKILDTLETLRAQAEEFGDQKFMTQVGNTITFFTRDFVVAGDQPTMAKVDEKKESLNESITFPMWNKIK